MVIGSRQYSGGGAQIPAVEDALDFLVDCLREKPPSTASYGYDLWISKVTDRYAQTEITPRPDHFEYPAVGQAVSGAFLDAAWQLCRLGVLRPGTREVNLQSHADGEGYSLTQFGGTWLAQHSSPAYVPTDPNRITSLLTRRQDIFGLVYVLRASNAALCYSAHAFYACCAMIGAAAESILLAAGTAKLGEAAALKIYLANRGRKALSDAVVKGCPDYVAKDLRMHTDLINLWRDESVHGYATSIGETEAFTNMRGLIRFAQFAEDRWPVLTAP